MVLSKFLSYAAVAIVSFIIGGGIRHYFACENEKKLIEDATEINETFFSRQPIEPSARLSKGIDFDSNPTFHATDLIKHLIFSAQETIYLAMYILTSEPLTDALVEAHKRGVKVFVIIDESMRNSSNYRINCLANAGVEIRLSNPTMHLKLCLIDVPYDRQKRDLQNRVKPQIKQLKDTFDKICFPKYGVTISGSMNWTREALTSNRETFTVTSKMDICKLSASEFFDIWEKGNLY